MAEAKAVEAVQFPPAYSGGYANEAPKRSTKSKILFGYAVAVTTALIVALILGGVYYYRSLDVIQEAIKKFQVTDNSGNTPVTQDVEVDPKNQYLVLRLDGADMAPGTFAVLDYAKSMTGIYDPKSKRCFLIGGIQSNIADLQTMTLAYEKNNSSQTKVNDKGSFYYTLADSYPVSDKKILPSALKDACTSLPVYWLQEAQPKDHSIQKRDICWITYYYSDGSSITYWWYC